MENTTKVLSPEEVAAKKFVAQVKAWAQQLKEENKRVFLPAPEAEEAVRALGRHGDNPNPNSLGFQVAARKVERIVTGVTGRL
jgi:hypothetical protein